MKKLQSFRTKLSTKAVNLYGPVFKYDLEGWSPYILHTILYSHEMFRIGRIKIPLGVLERLLLVLYHRRIK